MFKLCLGCNLSAFNRLLRKLNMQLREGFTHDTEIMVDKYSVLNFKLIRRSFDLLFFTGVRCTISTYVLLLLSV